MLLAKRARVDEVVRIVGAVVTVQVRRSVGEHYGEGMKGLNLRVLRP